MQKYESECKDFCSSVKDYEDGLFGKWHNGILKALSDPNQKQKY
jgi:hypothetical protein